MTPRKRREKTGKVTKRRPAREEEGSGAQYTPPDRREVVLLVHGVNSRGEWAPTVTSVLEPHFRVELFRYEEFRQYGFVKIALEPRARGEMSFLMAGVAAAGAGLAVVLGAPVTALALASAAGGLGASGAWLIRRPGATRKVANRLKLQVAERGMYGEAPHVVAHSYGTVLVGHILKTFPDVDLAHVVLCGSPLSMNFDWRRIAEGEAGRAEGVRNEVSAGDKVVRAAGWAASSLDWLGGAGTRGFTPRADIVHTADTSEGDCSSCTTDGVRALVHNVPSGDVGHSEPFLGSSHAARFWLPYFWRLDLTEHRLFFRLCTLALKLQPGRDQDYVWESLAYRPWQWLGGGSLSDVLNVVPLSWRMRSVDPVALGLYLLCQIVDEAKLELKKEKPRRSVIRALHPQIALQRMLQRLEERYG